MHQRNASPVAATCRRARPPNKTSRFQWRQSMNVIRSRHLRRPSSGSNDTFRFHSSRPMRRTIVAAAAVALLSTGCGGGDDNSASAVPQLNGLTGATKDATVEFKEGTNMAADAVARRPADRLHRAGCAVGRAVCRRQRDADHAVDARADGAGLVARRQGHRIPELHVRRQLAHLDDPARRLRSQGADDRILRRPRAGLDAGRLGPRVRVRPQQRRPVQDLELHAQQRRCTSS